MSQSLILLSVLTAVILAGCPKKPTAEELRNQHNEKVIEILDSESLDAFDTGTPLLDAGVQDNDGSTDGSDAAEEKYFDVIGC